MLCLGVGGPAAASPCFPLVPVRCGADSESSPVGPLCNREKEGREVVESDSELNQGGWNSRGWGGPGRVGGVREGWRDGKARE